jgi:ABC-type transport system substrate-binding protein
MTHLPQHPGYWLNPEENALGNLSANYLYDVAEARKLMQAAGYNNPVDLPFFTLPVGGQVVEDNQLVIDSLKAAGLFNVDVRLSPNATEHRTIRTELKVDGLIEEIGTSGSDVDRHVYRTLHSQGNQPRSPQPFPDARLDSLVNASRRELDVEKRFGILKDMQKLAAEHMMFVPGRHMFTTFGFRWPWLHNIGQGNAGSPPTGNPSLGGHLQWLDTDMPNRDRAI